MTRDYDLIVFGASGFTGRHTAEYLAKHAPKGLKWAIAGRDPHKLDAVKAKLDAGGRDVHTLVANVDDAATIHRLAACTRVLLTTAGPFVDYGEPVVRACVDEGTDYVDSTGEPHFVHTMLERYSNAAAQRGVRLIPCCGFDSVPADLGALFTVRQLPKERPIRLTGCVSLKGSFSGGTMRSVIKTLELSRRGEPSLVPDPGGHRRVHLEEPRIGRRKEIGAWLAPFPTIDASIVLRSAALMEEYGPDFTYGHAAVHASLPKMLGALWAFGSLKFLARFAPVRAFLWKLAKNSGEGPSEDEIDRNWFKIRFLAECDGRTLQTEVSGGDPATRETSKMLSESALCLIEDRDKLPALSGVLTPAQAFGETLIGRLERAGVRFGVV